MGNAKLKDLRKYPTAGQRRRALEGSLGILLQNIGRFSLDEKIASTRNCENMIGVTQIPLGVAGPIKIKFGKSRTRSCFVPLATTEGALVASVNRGCRAISLAGGATVLIEEVGITRGPVFETVSLSESFRLSRWLKASLADLNELCRETSRHLELKRLETQVLGRNVFARFYFDSQEAMGMNGATIALSRMVSFIEREIGSRCVSLSGNFCIDKKPAWLNFILGRGKKVWAEATVPREVVKEVLKTEPEKIIEIWLKKCLLGSAAAGSLGFNGHFGNVVAGIFAATGQDLAQVTEGSLGITTTELSGNGLYISIYLPDLLLGTVGGGTLLETQKEALSLTGIKSGEKGGALRLAETVGGAVLAGELSLLASLAEGSLASAHQKLGRG
jgi:hydroxymethylglutaryl-CoA reductase (NADPH)